MAFFSLWKFHPPGQWPQTKSWKPTNIQQQSSCRTLEGRGLVKAVRRRRPQEQSFTSYRSQCFFMFVISLVNSNGLMARPLVLSNEILPSLLQGKKKWRYQKGLACTSRARLPILATAAMNTKDQWDLNYMLQGQYERYLGPKPKPVTELCFYVKIVQRNFVEQGSSSGQDLSNPKFLACC